ncbi:GntP family permease [Chitinasiproducens palmae]|uniref:H+/gluconate symporter n=1 Tax=Chitinasiproducens palmae TaxID=1770053 RepID=A0A1H2PNQ9_9BURK|nr:GntP family permease [Chitinasiproducens palmae]SDV48336.1 H+/gluconate symporter [Chitinasiproducens palmae]
MDFLIVLAALLFLMFAAYRGYSVILFAPIAALGAVLLTNPAAVAPIFNTVFMPKMVSFVELYLPVFLLGAVFGKLIELSGYSKAIVRSVINLIGPGKAIATIVIVCALLTYGGVSLFVVVFTVYPFAAELFRQSGIPKRLMGGTIALGAFSFTMDSVPGTPQIQNIIPSAFFKTTTWAAPWLGLAGSAFIIVLGLTYLNWRRRQAMAAGEGYGTALVNEPAPFEAERLPNPVLAFAPLVLVGALNFAFTRLIPLWYGATYSAELPGLPKPLVVDIKKMTAIWSVEAALLVGIIFVLIFAFRTIARRFAEGSRQAVSGALLASINTASEYGFGGVIAALPGFAVVSGALQGIPNPLVKEAVSVTALAGITGSASGGLSIALAAMSQTFIDGAQAAGIPMEVLHRVAAMASGGMDTLPHNGAVITLLAVTGLTHRQAYKDIFAITLLKTLAVFFVIGLYYTTGIV